MPRSSNPWVSAVLPQKDPPVPDTVSDRDRPIRVYSVFVYLFSPEHVATPLPGYFSVYIDTISDTLFLSATVLCASMLHGKD